MSDDAESIRQRMQNVRRSVGDDVEGIVHTAKTLSDWRYYVKNHPWACLGAAFAAGYFLMPKRKLKLPEGVDSKQLIELLKSHNISLAKLGSLGAAPLSGGASGLAKTALAAAAPLVMRAVMDYAQQRFVAGGPAPTAPSPDPARSTPSAQEEP
jgi:hypothetical protein